MITNVIHINIVKSPSNEHFNIYTLCISLVKCHTRGTRGSWHHHNMLQCSPALVPIGKCLECLEYVYIYAIYIMIFRMTLDIPFQRWIFHWVKNLNTIDAFGCADIWCNVHTVQYSQIFSVCLFVLFRSVFSTPQSAYSAYIRKVNVHMTHAVFTIHKILDYC